MTSGSPSGVEHLLNASNYFVVLNKFTAIQLRKTFFDFLPEPLIVINEPFHQFLNYLFGCTSTFGSDMTELRL